MDSARYEDQRNDDGAKITYRGSDKILCHGEARDRGWLLPIQGLTLAGGEIALVICDVVDVAGLLVVVFDERGEVAGDLKANLDVGEELIPPAFVGVRDAIAVEVNQLAFGDVTEAPRRNAGDDVGVVDEAEGLCLEALVKVDGEAVVPDAGLTERVEAVDGQPGAVVEQTGGGSDYG